MTRRNIIAPLALAATLAAGALGCSNGGSLDAARLLRPPAPVGPAADSPAAMLRLFEWAYNNKADATHRTLFTEDFRFVFDPADSSGLAYPTTPWGRDDELASATHLFVGGKAGRSPASSITLRLDRNFVVTPDPSSIAWDPEGRWHASVRTQIFLTIQCPDGAGWDISGAATFALVRGDSALIPADLVDRGFLRDSTRWWIDRCLDETAHPDGGGGVAVAATMRRPAPLETQPTSNTTWGSVKVLYR
ncbi:MAG: hypothetical protein E6K81_14595 [Candidatus Eisenbacteria bacterium]|uniref:Nuclear transport factor 2 family protein n=1 Tax=Eiseniibacteriota bacterium TaxID=2212470 RepID=A0A538U104_UNCEI|nr:MAG: hypothetical protein E6K81_14595 [Candidatus Eisenbacteria bacterium]